LSVKVSRPALHRALRIFQAIIVGAESRGGKVNGGTEQRESAIKVGEEDVALRLREKLKRSDNRSSGSSWPTYTLKPTGLLMLEITDYIGATNKVAWRDTKTWPLENQIQDIVEGITEAGEALRKLKIERAEQGKRHREEEAQRLALQKRADVERRLRNELFAHLEWYERSAVLARLIKSVREHQLPSFWSEEARNRWLDWAEKVQKQLDPFSNGYFSEELAKAQFEAGFQWPKPQHDTWTLNRAITIPNFWP
jgi:hypothetical protein